MADLSQDNTPLTAATLSQIMRVQNFPQGLWFDPLPLLDGSGNDSFGGRYACGFPIGDTDSTFAWNANKLWFVPFLVPQGASKITRLAISVQTGGAGSVARMGIYDDLIQNSGIHTAGALLGAGLPELDTSTTGGKTHTMNVPVANKSILWACYICSTTAPTLDGWSSGRVVSPFGYASSAITTQRRQVQDKPQTYGALPDPAPTGLNSEGAAAGMPGIWVSYQ